MNTQNEVLSRRDQIAIAALQGVITANVGKKVTRLEMAQIAVMQADELIKALDKS